ncbi:MAG: ABC transporter permease [Actinomycetota bacterium]|nr:ABC transporter permease [Actinomycetota bacterium]
MSTRRRGSAPYLLSFPGVLWLALFFLVPMITMFSVSLQEGTLETGFVFTGRWRNYLDALGKYDTQMIRSVTYGLIVTILTLVISFPIAYWIARKAGNKKNLVLLLLLLPFFTPYLLRTISWQTILADEGLVLGTLKDWGVLGDSFRLLATPVAVISGMTYNFLPFMALPLYVALERMDPALLEAASDLYSTRRQAFFKVTLPLSLPGVFAGSLLTFIPAVGDYVDPEILGGVNTTMIGQVIQREMLNSFDFPEGAAIAFILMAAILLGVFFYARALGTEELTG